jgi:5-formyltetrahydrofolate cyclo-ligase
LKKNLARKSHLEKRENLTKEQFKDFEKQTILNCIELIKKLKPKVVHCYLPISNKLEINTELIFNFCWKNNIKTVVPISDFKNNTMTSALYNNETELEINQYRIPEPKNPEIIINKEIDFIVTPLLAFDKTGQRVGFGKGFYDRFFIECKTNAKKVGISLFEPIDQIEDLNQYDIPLDHSISPTNIFNF